jgi:DNA-directed RNA polymerase subunit F
MKILRPEQVTPEALAALRPLSPEELKEAYALARAAFTAEDLQRFTEIVEDVPAHDVLRELEQAQKQFDNHKAP